MKAALVAVRKSFIRFYIKRPFLGKYSIQKVERRIFWNGEGDAKADDRFAHGRQPLF